MNDMGGVGRIEAESRKGSTVIAPACRIYTFDYVEARLREMGTVLRALPDKDARWLVNGCRSFWPAMLQNPSEAYGYNPPERTRVHPTPDQIDRCDECLTWLMWLSEDDRTLVLARACGFRMPIVAHRLGLGRTTAWMRHKRAIERLTQSLNGGPTPLTVAEPRIGKGAP